MGWESAKLNPVISGGGDQACRFVQGKGTPRIWAVGEGPTPKGNLHQSTAFFYYSFTLAGLAQAGAAPVRAGNS